MTKIRLDVIGDPIEHSKSPYIHETVLEEIAVPYEYRRVKVEKGHLPEYLAEVKQLGISGFNLTMPHKSDIIPYLDFIDDEARLFNSVNTVKVIDGKLMGYNTDANGFLAAIDEKGYTPKDKNIVFLGAGSVVSTLALKMAAVGAKSITVLNRTLSSAEKISKSVSQKTNKEVCFGTLNAPDITSAVSNCDILINATPLGMVGTDCDFEDLSFLNSLKSGALVQDLIYNPAETRLLKTAKGLGFKTLNGLGMLVYQGLLADEIFLDRSLDFADFKAKIENKLKNLNFF